jgi:hypothetical protein
MKAISLYQPWATLVVLGIKRLETRRWQTTHSGLLAIHASRTFPAEGRELCRQEPFRSLLARAGFSDEYELPRGALLGMVQLRRCLRIEEIDLESLAEAERTAGDFSPGRWAWVLEQAEPFLLPISCPGQRGVFTVSREFLP